MAMWQTKIAGLGLILAACSTTTTAGPSAAADSGSDSAALPDTAADAAKDASAAQDASDVTAATDTAPVDSAAVDATPTGADTAATPDGAADGDDAAPADAAQVDAAPTDSADAADTADAAYAADAADAASDATTVNEDCPERAKVVYVVTQENKLFNFSPDTLKSNLIGTLNCPGESGSPFSMSVDRNATAWVVFNDGNLYRVSTIDASCLATPFVANQSGFDVFGMGFSADSPGAITEQLYVLGGSPGGFTMGPNKLATIDLNTFKLTSIAKLSPIVFGADLSGNGNGELWGFFAGTSPPSVRQLDKTNANVGKAYLLPAADFDGIASWAFASWGGDFYLFSLAGSQTKTAVFKLDGATGVTTKVINNFGYVVVGAGVSSCAPTGKTP